MISAGEEDLLDLFCFDLARDFVGVFFLSSPIVSITTSIVVAFMYRVLSIFICRSLYFGEVFFSLLFKEIILSKGKEMLMSRQVLFCPSLSSICVVMTQRILASSFSVTIKGSCSKCFL